MDGSIRKSREFWDPKRRGPVCYYPGDGQDAAADPLDSDKTGIVWKIERRNEGGYEGLAVEKGEQRAIEPDGMAYMLSKQGHLNDICGNCAPHLMFYLSLKDGNTWGAGVQVRWDLATWLGWLHILMVIRSP